MRPLEQCSPAFLLFPSHFPTVRIYRTNAGILAKSILYTFQHSSKQQKRPCLVQHVRVIELPTTTLVKPGLTPCKVPYKPICFIEAEFLICKYACIRYSCSSAHAFNLLWWQDERPKPYPHFHSKVNPSDVIRKMFEGWVIRFIVRIGNVSKRKARLSSGNQEI